MFASGDNLIIYIVGPLVGGAIAVSLLRYLNFKEK